jgi:hypothetical protein
LEGLFAVDCRGGQKGRDGDRLAEDGADGVKKKRRWSRSRSNGERDKRRDRWERRKKQLPSGDWMKIEEAPVACSKARPVAA